MRSIGHSVGKSLQRGFTLVELLIVVIILAILAAIVIPQFSGATIDAQESALDSNLNAMRSAIELYRVQHKGKYPSAVAATGLTCTVGTAGTGAINTDQALKDQLSHYSNVEGQTCSGADPQTKLGPYLRKGIPAEPINNSTAISILSTSGAPISVSGTTGGWVYNNITGQILMNSTDTDNKTPATAYSTH